MVAGISEKEYEKRNNLIGWAVSLGFHLLIIFLLINALAWKRQIPPPPEYGMEVNFGLDDQGFGDVQELTPSSEEPQPKQASQELVQQEEPQQQEQEAEPEKIIRGDEVVNMPPAKTEVAVKPAPVPAEAPKTAPAKTPSAASLFPSDNGGSSSNNNGNKPGTTGDMGKANGNPDVRGIYDGNPGKGAGGSSLDMAGWRWDSKPQVRDDSNEEGRIVFEVKVDEEGNIVSVRALEKSVSPALVRKYQKEVENLSFSRTSGGNNGQGATGRITFIISSK
jgi:outer membrane biosynthesis protein TonB